MKNFVSNGKTIDVTLAANIASGAALLIGTLLGIAVTSGVIGDVVVFNVEGVYTLPKDTSTFAVGAAVYWDDTAKKVTTTTSGNTLIGKAWEGAATGVTEIAVKLAV